MELYNMKDEEYKNYIKGLCIANIPIDFYGLKINHIKVLDIFNMGEDEYKKIIYPMTLTKEVLLKDTNIDVNLLDLLTSDIYYDSLVKCLCMILDLKKEDIGVVSLDGLHNEIIINKFGVFITGGMFDQLKDIVLFINCLKETKIEDIEDNSKTKELTYEQIMKIKDRRERDYQLAIYKRNKKDNKKQNNIFSLYNLYNYVSHFYGKFDYEKALNLNIYQLYNTYNVLIKTEKYNSDMGLLSSGMISASDIKKIDNRWFSERIVEE